VKQWLGDVLTLIVFAGVGHFVLTFAISVMIVAMRTPGNDMPWGEGWEATKEVYATYWDKLCPSGG